MGNVCSSKSLLQEIREVKASLTAIEGIIFQIENLKLPPVINNDAPSSQT